MSSPGHREPLISSRSKSPSRLAVKEYARSEGSDYLCRLVLRTIVHYDKLKEGYSLAHSTVNRLSDEPRPIVYRNYYTNPCLAVRSR